MTKPKKVSKKIKTKLIRFKIVDLRNETKKKSFLKTGFFITNIFLKISKNKKLNDKNLKSLLYKNLNF